MTPEIDQRFASLENCQPIQLANYSGVYFLCQGATVLYVGKARNIARRITDHLSDKDFDTVMVMHVPEELLHSVEMHWVRRLRPILNRIQYQEDAKTKLTKDVKTIYLPHDVSRQLARAAKEANISQSVYVMQVLQAHFKRKGIE